MPEQHPHVVPVDMTGQFGTPASDADNGRRTRKHAKRQQATIMTLSNQRDSAAACLRRREEVSGEVPVR